MSKREQKLDVPKGIGFFDRLGRKLKNTAAALAVGSTLYAGAAIAEPGRQKPAIVETVRGGTLEQRVGSIPLMAGEYQEVSKPNNVLESSVTAILGTPASPKQAVKFLHPSVSGRTCTNAADGRNQQCAYDQLVFGVTDSAGEEYIDPNFSGITAKLFGAHSKFSRNDYLGLKQIADVDGQQAVADPAAWVKQFYYAVWWADVFRQFRIMRDYKPSDQEVAHYFANYYLHANEGTYDPANIRVIRESADGTLSMSGNPEEDIFDIVYKCPAKGQCKGQNGKVMKHLPKKGLAYKVPGDDSVYRHILIEPCDNARLQPNPLTKRFERWNDQRAGDIFLPAYLFGFTGYDEEGAIEDTPQDPTTQPVEPPVKRPCDGDQPGNGTQPVKPGDGGQPVKPVKPTKPVKPVRPYVDDGHGNKIIEGTPTPQTPREESGLSVSGPSGVGVAGLYVAGSPFERGGYLILGNVDLLRLGKRFNLGVEFGGGAANSNTTSEMFKSVGPNEFGERAEYFRDSRASRTMLAFGGSLDAKLLDRLNLTGGAGVLLLRNGTSVSERGTMYDATGAVMDQQSAVARPELSDAVWKTFGYADLGLDVRLFKGFSLGGKGIIASDFDGALIYGGGAYIMYRWR